MANKPLRSITFPGLDDTYTVAATDTTLSISGEPADAAAVGDALDSKANATGTYDDLTAGSANQLLSTTGVTDKAPYTLRATGGGAAGIGGRAVEKIVGGAVCWNQICNHAGGSGTQYGITFTNNGDGSWTLTGEATATGRKGHSTSMALSSRADHIICVTHGAEIDGSDSTFECVLTSSGSLKGHVYDAGWQMRKLVAASSINTFDIRVFSGWNPGSTGVTLRPQIIDLTAMFGSAVADAVYAMEQASEGAGVAWFRAMFPASYYPYNAGELMSVQAASHDMVGFNAYDPSTGAAILLGGYQYQISGTYTSISYEDINGNAETITPDASGIFTPVSNGTLTVTGGNSADTCVHLVHSGYRNGEDEPYGKHSYPLDSSLTLRGLPKLDGAVFHRHRPELPQTPVFTVDSREGRSAKLTFLRDFCREKACDALLLGGGVGVPPLYMLAKELKKEGKNVSVILGFNTESEVFYEKEFASLGCDVKVATADGSYGVKGFVTDAIKEGYTYFYTCGPEPMLKAVYKATSTSGQFSFEERMGCGFGACMEIGRAHV